MAGRLNYEKAKRNARRGESEYEHWNTSGWRTDYPAEFPVTRRSLYDPRVANPKQTDSTLLTEEAQL
jgi:hypothetical protein